MPVIFINLINLTSFFAAIKVNASEWKSVCWRSKNPANFVYFLLKVKIQTDLSRAYLRNFFTESQFFVIALYPSERQAWSDAGKAQLRSAQNAL